MNGLTILGVIAFAIACRWFYRMATWERMAAARDARRGRTNTEKVEAVFTEIWNGEEISREAAWFRTVERLKMGNYPDEMITEAELRLLFLEYGYDNNSQSHYTINKNGRLVHITEIGGRDASGLTPKA